MKVVAAGPVTIAALDGHAEGDAVLRALACDVRIAADTATLAVPFAAAVRLTRLVGEARAKDAVLTGRTLDAAEALRLGLVTRVVPAARLLDEAEAAARAVRERPPVLVMNARAALADGA
jgi:enoyl-CoA hydratase/carnithine racemase